MAGLPSRSPLVDLSTLPAFAALRRGSLRLPLRCGRRLAGVAGLEPVTSAVTGQRSNQLSYTPEGGDVKIVIPPRFVNVQPNKKSSGSRRQGGGGGEPR